MNQRSDEISLLLSRLIHPSGMVREKTCTAFASLLVRPTTREFALKGLQSWTQQQVLESVAISSLLIHIRARLIDSTYDLPEPAELVGNFSRPSLLSWMLTTELYRSGIDAPIWKDLHSGIPPAEFQTEEFFKKYAASLIGWGPVKRAHSITKETQFPFYRQWAWESSLLVKFTSLKIRDRVFWQRGDSDSKWYASYYFRLTDILISAYLRALACSVERRALSVESAAHHAALLSPIDLALWKVEPKMPPLWWPKRAAHSKTTESSEELVVQELEAAWKEFACGESEWLPAQANGFVRGNDQKVFLEIYGLFQWCLGPRQPKIAEIAEWCKRIVSETFLPQSGLKISGRLLPSNLHQGNRQRQFGQWVVAPAFEIIPFSSGINWQWWRYYRKVWAPSSFLVDSAMTIKATTEALEFKEGTNEVARWFDWSNSLDEKLETNLPPFTGQCLLINRRFVEKIDAPAMPSFCWIWSVTLFDRPYESGKYKITHYHGQLGTSLSIRG